MEQSFDVAVLDVHLGSDNSFPLAERLTRERTPHLFLTGDEAEVATGVTADHILQKPFDTKTFVAMVARHLGA